MLQIKKITNKNIWEKFLTEEYPLGYPFFQSWLWGDIQEKLGIGIVRLGLFDGEKLLGILQIVDVKAKRGHYLYLRHGPVFRTFDPVSMNMFLTYAKNVAKERGAAFIRVSRFPEDTQAKEYFKKAGFIHSAIQTIDAEVCWILDITKSEDELLKNMRKSHRYLVKKSQTAHIKIIKTKDSQELKRFLPLYKELSIRKHFIAHKGVVEEFETFAGENEEVLFLAEYEGTIIAGAMIAFVGNTAIYRHSASDDRYKNIPASYLIQWEAIKEAKKRGKKIYNFWGIAPIGEKDHPWAGLTLFKTGFGGSYEHFLPTLDLPLNIKYWKNYLIDWISAKKKAKK